MNLSIILFVLLCHGIVIGTKNCTGLLTGGLDLDSLFASNRERERERGRERERAGNQQRHQHRCLLKRQHQSDVGSRHSWSNSVFVEVALTKSFAPSRPGGLSICATASSQALAAPSASRYGHRGLRAWQFLRGVLRGDLGCKLSLQSPCLHRQSPHTTPDSASLQQATTGLRFHGCC